MDSVEILEAVERAKAFKLCLRRIWAVAGSLPEREHSLPSLIPAPDRFPVPSHNMQHQKHEQCTFDFCEQSRVDFTSVPQRHEMGCRHDCDTIHFPPEVLNERVAKGEPTAWRLNDERALLDTSKPYMAISHVWADGTGAGNWSPGEVNSCLYRFFCGIAEDFQCEGCWWDAISIPQDKEARGEALNNMHNNYASARLTLVHDSFLREWEWVDAESACFAIVMSPWFSRGWTALELANSRKVKILFKSRNDGYVAKDLDIDILAQMSSSDRRHTIAGSIRQLRNASIKSFGDLLAILSARDTSRPRDIPIISGLLAGVDVSGGLSQQEIYQRILRKLGRVAQGHLFHNSATMSSQGFGWCPTNILDMPQSEANSAQLELQENGALIGAWKVYAVSSVPPDNYIWKDTHPLTRVALESALTGDSSKEHLLLVENELSKSRALLVKLMNDEGEMNMPCCQFVGPVYFRSSSLPDEKYRDNYQVTKVRLGGTDGLQQLSGNAWENLCYTVGVSTKGSSMEETGVTVPSRHASFDEDDPVSLGSRDWKALFYTEKTASKLVWNAPLRYTLPGSDLELLVVEDSGYNATETQRAYLYGNRDVLSHVQTWLKGQADIETGHAMLLVFDEDNTMKKDSVDTKTKNSMAGNALLVAATEGPEPLVTLLADDHATHAQSLSKETALHLAARKGFSEAVKRLLTSMTNAATVDLANLQGQTALHLAAKNGRTTVVKLLVEKSEALDAQDSTGSTALHLAVKENHSEIVQILLSSGIDLNIQDSEEQTALHLAAEAGHNHIVLAILKHGVDTEKQDRMEETTLDETASDGFGETAGSIHGKRVLLDKVDVEGQTALHLAAKNGHMSVVEVLLDHGARETSMDSGEKTTLQLAVEGGHTETVLGLLKTDQISFDQEKLDEALLSAAEIKQKEIVATLLDYKARSDLQDSEGMTALHWAIEGRDVDNAKRLIGTQSNINIQDKQKRTALLIAAAQGMAETAKALLSEGASFTFSDSEDRTALHWAAKNRHVEVIEVLVNVPGVESYINQTDSSRRTVLHWAILSGSQKATKLILDRKAHHVPQDKNGRTALILAAEKGRIAAVKLLLEYGVDLKTSDYENRTALQWAAIGGFDKVVYELLRPDHMIPDEDKQRALEFAAEKGHSAVAMRLYEKIEDPDIRDSVISTVLFSAATNGYAPLMDKFLGFVADPNLKDQQGRTALILAAENEHSLVIEALLSTNAMGDLKDNGGRTALMVAAINGNLSIVYHLLKAQVSKDLQDLQGRTALHFAVEREHSDIIAALLRAGANPNLQDSRKRTVLHLIMENFSNDLPTPQPFQSYSFGSHSLYRLRRTMRQLLFANTKPEIQDQNGQTVLHLIAKAKNEFIASYMPLSLILHRDKSLDIQDTEGRTPLLLASEKKYGDLVERLLDDNFQPDTQDKWGRTALLLAAENGDNDSVQLLLAHNADANLSDYRGRTPLLQAAHKDHELVVATLLDEKASPDARDAMGRTALLSAAENGNDSVVVKLLQKIVSSTASDNDKKRAWQKAADRGHASVVNILLGEGPDAQIQDRKAINEAFLSASMKGQIKLVRAFLNKGAELNFRNDKRQTALHLASMNGHQEVVKTLIENGVDMIRDTRGRTSLLLATENGFESIVKLLLQRSEVSTDMDGWMGPQALLFAAEKGLTAIAELLLTHKLNYDAVNPTRRTAMALAAANGNTRMVELLLKKGAKSAIEDKHKRTPLHHAAWGGFKDVVYVLLANGADPTALDARGQSALHLAAERAAKDVIEELLRSRTNTNVKSGDGQTALHRAAWGGSCEAVTLLRKHGADPFLCDNAGNPPWKVAAEKGHESIAQELLSEEQILQDEDIGKEKALIFAARLGYSALARSLLEKGLEPAVKDRQGRTPLHLAAERGDKELVRIFAEKGKEWIDVPDRQRQTALCLAVYKGHVAVVEELLQKSASANIRGKNGQTVLHLAAKEGNWEIVQTLLSDKADPHIRDDRGRKAWQLGAEGCHHQIVRLLLEREVDVKLQSRKKDELYLQMVERVSLPMIQLLLGKGVNKDVQDPLGRTAVCLATRPGKEEILRMLLREGANPSIPDAKGQTPLMWAAKTGSEKAVSLLLDNFASKLQDIDDESDNGSHINADKKSSEVVDNESSDEASVRNSAATDSTEKEIIRKEEINASDLGGRTALLIAVIAGGDNIAKLLLDKGSSDPDVQDVMGRTALQLASEKGSINLVKMLLKKSARQDLKDQSGRAALLLAAEKGHTAIVKALLENDFNFIDIRDSLERTALQLAAEKGHKEVVEILLKNGADPDLQDSKGRTALLLAAENGDEQIVSVLLEKGASQQKDSAGRTPLLLAVANGDGPLVKLLLKGVNADSLVDPQGRKLLHLAVTSGNKEVAWLLAQKEFDDNLWERTLDS